MSEDGIAVSMGDNCGMGAGMVAGMVDDLYDISSATMATMFVDNVRMNSYKAFRAGVYHTAKFQRADLWKVDLKSFDNIVIFGVSGMVSAD